MDEDPCKGYASQITNDALARRCAVVACWHARDGEAKPRAIIKFAE